MTREEFGSAYQRNFRFTVRFLMSRGITEDIALETAQSAWTRGWERLSQLRDPNMLLLWLNRVALNIYRSLLRREPTFLELPELPAPPRSNCDAIDVARILSRCKAHERGILRDHYINEMQVGEIAEKNGWKESTTRVRLLRARRSARTHSCEPSNAVQ